MLPTKEVILDVDGSEVRIGVVACAELQKVGSTPLFYLQYVRYNVADRNEIRKTREQWIDGLPQRYERAREFQYVPALVLSVETPVDALLSPRSDQEQLQEPYREALKNKFPRAADLTDRLCRCGEQRSSTDASYNEVRAGLVYREPVPEICTGR